VIGKILVFHSIDRGSATAASHHSIMIQYGDSVGGDPYVAFETGRAQAEREGERLDRVIRSVGPGSSVGEGDRWVQKGRESLLHQQHCATVTSGEGDRVTPRAET
jgi:hypothetical protein